MDQVESANAVRTRRPGADRREEEEVEYRDWCWWGTGCAIEELRVEG